MKLKSRVNRLEDKSGHGFIVVMPKYENWSGKPETGAFRLDTDEVGAIGFSTGVDHLTIERQAKERFEDFEARAISQAREELSATVILPRHADFL